MLLPDVLFKYYSPARIQTIEDGAMRFTPPTDFNDTFDSDYLISTTAPKARVARGRYRSNLGIFCLTRNPNNHLMWVHYAAQNTGFVVGFNTSAPVFSVGDSLLDEIDYTDDPLLVVPRTSDPPLKIALTKSTDWSYEQEWRCVRTFQTEESRDVYFNPDAINEIILGSRMADHDVSRLLRYANVSKVHGGHEVVVSDSKPMRKTRRFEREPSDRMLCSECDGAGYIRDKSKAPGHH